MMLLHKAWVTVVRAHLEAPFWTNYIQNIVLPGINVLQHSYNNHYKSYVTTVYSPLYCDCGTISLLNEVFYGFFEQVYSTIGKFELTAHFTYCRGRLARGIIISFASVRARATVILCSVWCCNRKKTQENANFDNSYKGTWMIRGKTMQWCQRHTQWAYQV